MNLLILTLAFVIVETIQVENPESKHLISTNFLQPLHDSVNDLVAITKHPNFGGIQLLHPWYLLQKFHEKFTGPSSAHHDYPFAYRKS